MSISGIVVQTRPEDLEAVSEELKKSGLCELFFSDRSGKIVVTVESEGPRDEMQKMTAIQNLPNVLSVRLAYSYYGEEEDEAADRGERDRLMSAGDPPQPLNI